MNVSSYATSESHLTSGVVVTGVDSLVVHVPRVGVQVLVTVQLPQLRPSLLGYKVSQEEVDGILLLAVSVLVAIETPVGYKVHQRSSSKGFLEA